MIYLDNSATTKIRTEVLEAMKPFQEESFGNASSMHRVGRQSRFAIEESRRQVAELLGSDSTEIFFSPSATVSNNTAILGRAFYVESKGLGRHIITTKIEHSSALLPVKFLESKGWNATYLDVDADGFINLDELEAAITPDTSIISIMWANNEIGTIQPVKEVGEIAKRHGIFFHCDSVQVPGKIAIDVNEIGADTLSLSGHKFGGPKGIGVLFVREGSTLTPIYFGGGQEQGLFPGTESVAQIVGIGKAAELCKLELEQNRTKLFKNQSILLERLLRYPNTRLTGPADLTRRLPGHVSVVVPSIAGADLVLEADMRGVCISSASACSSGKQHVSHVLEAIGVSNDDAIGSLRISSGVSNSHEDCQLAADILNDVISQATLVISSPIAHAPVPTLA